MTRPRGRPDSGRVSVLGLGRMGLPIAQTLQRHGVDVVGWNRSTLPPERTGQLRLCRTIEEAVRSEAILLVLADSEAVDAVLAHIEPLLVAGTIIVDLGSSDPERSRAHAERLGKAGLGFVDAPVSGGPEGADAGRLAIMAGGAEADVESIRSLLEKLGTVVHVGGPGAGDTVKIVNQVIVGLTLEAVAEAMALAVRAGLDPHLVREALRGGSADSRLLQVQGKRMVERDFAPRGSVRTMLKDGRLALALAGHVGVELPHLRSLVAAWEELVDRGRADDDCSALITRLLDDRS